MTTNPPEPPGDPAEPAEAAEPTEAAEPIKPTEPVKPAEPAEAPAASTANFGTPPPGYDQSPPGRATSRLQRSSADRVLTGVCGGLGRHTGVDPILFRIGFVALVFAAGTGILLYLALAILMPRDDGQQIWSRAGDRRSGGGDPGGAAGAAYGPPLAPAVPSGPRSPVPGVTLAILLIGLGVVALGERFGDWSVDPSTYFAIAVAAVGIALLVSAFGPWRRSKGGLIVLGVMLSFGLFVTSAVDSRGGFDQATFGERSYRPVSADQVRDTYQVLMGQTTLDLSGLDFEGEEPIEIRVTVTMGNFQIFLPRDVDLRITGDATFGSVSAFGDRDYLDGYYPGDGEGPDVGDNEPELILDLDVRFGNAEVTRVG